MALSSKRIGHRPFTAAMPGSNPAGVTTSPQTAHPSLPSQRLCRRAESSFVPLRLLLPTGPASLGSGGAPYGCVAQMVSAPACHAGGRGFDPRHGRQRPLRLIGQDASLSSWKRGFKSRRGHHVAASCTSFASGATASPSRRKLTRSAAAPHPHRSSLRWGPHKAAYSNGKRAVLKTVRRETVCGFESYRCRHSFGSIAKLERQRSANP